MRVGFMQTLAMVTSDPGTIERGDHPEAGGRGVARHDDVLGLQLRLAA